MKNQAELINYLKENNIKFTKEAEVIKFSGGQSNPTYLIKDSQAAYVLRRKPNGDILKSAHAIDREYKVLKALYGTAVPVAKPILYCTDKTIIGSEFYLMEFVDGQIYWDPQLSEVLLYERKDIYQEIIKLMARLHEVNIAEVGLSDYGRHSGYFERQLNRWIQQYRLSETETIESIELLIVWLQKNLPEDDGQFSLIHGDFRLDNFIFSNDKPKIIAVLDWELSTIGHPLADLAYFCMCLHLPQIGPIPGLQGLDREKLGVPSEQEIIQQYQALRGIDEIKHWDFYLLFSFFRLTAILQGVYKRALSGNASNSSAMEVGQMAGILADIAVNLIPNKE